MGSLASTSALPEFLNNSLGSNWRPGSGKVDIIRFIKGELIKLAT